LIITIHKLQYLRIKW